MTVIDLNLGSRLMPPSGGDTVTHMENKNALLYGWVSWRALGTLKVFS